MVPTNQGPGPHLNAVLPSCVAALGGAANLLGLPARRGIVVVVVDGLGASALKARRGYARTMAAAMGPRAVLTTGVATTTAAALTTLMTGALPGEHGVVGYSVLDRAADRVVNQLTGWGGTVDPLRWQRVPTLFETGDVRGVAIGPGKFRGSGFSAAILRGAAYVAADDIAERFDAAVRELAAGGRPLVYLYIPELDMAAHADGWQSERWSAVLEEVDSALAATLPRLGRDAALLVTADHGIVDVPGFRHVLVDERTDLIDGVRHVAGEPRMLHLYAEPELGEAERVALLGRWRAAEGERAWVRSRAEAVAEGWFGSVHPEVAPRIGDILIAARASVAYYDTRTATVGSRAMIGQHGSWTPEETRIPLLRFGA